MYYGWRAPQSNIIGVDPGTIGTIDCSIPNKDSTGVFLYSGQ
jgi:hypothetical protein